MARRKKPEDETLEQAEQRRLFEKICDHATRSEKVSWHRMMDNMISLLAKLRPIEDKIIKLNAEKTPIMDDIAMLRQRMVRDCVHPYEQLVIKDGSVECKFCNKRFFVNQPPSNLEG
jgi:hypothetical protein